MRSKPQPPLAQQISQIQNLLLEGKIIEAEHQAQNLLQEVPNNEEVHLLIAKTCQELGKVDVSVTHLNHLLQLNQHHAEANKLLANHHFNSSDFDAALTHINIALAQSCNSEAQELKGLILSGLHEYDKAIETLLGVIDSAQDSWLTWNNLANQHRNLGLFKEAKEYYLKAIELSGSNDIPYNNLITFLHYLPDSKKNELKSLYNNWEEKYSRNGLATKHQADIQFKNKTIRIGMVSDGFRSHPVGQMITSALEELPENEIELYLYSTNSTEDQLTYRTKKASEKWMTVTHLSEEKLAQEFINDKIDILFDLCGHNNGCRIRTMVMKPAPILVKWVGGLINTTGLSTMDYLLSDNIETPAGEDEFYTEKLIRMPDDYICYDAPIYTPDIYSPPEKRNGYITLGCFNNPTKLNTVLLAEWAKIMHSLPESRLFLKGFQFSSEVLRENIRNQLKDLGINENRVLIEGPSHHEELLKSYNKVDIALDTWPYSGGLTTCEAMYMGVPVVTLPGPTFAGRHSATHLTNAGMPQLVAESWEHYHDLVVTLASDIDNLSNIRKHLRSALLESPVCDAKRFARNFSNAMRAIWQRYCEGKQPAALTLDNEGNALFADEAEPVLLQLPEEPVLVEDDDFHFRFNGKIVVLDNGASFSSISSFIDLHKIGVLSTLCLDPGNRIANAQQLKQTGDFQHVPMTTLGNGEQVLLSITQDPAYSGTLQPLDFDQQPEQTALKYQQIAQVPINTIRLDDIAGINTLELLVLDNLNDLDLILANGENTLAHPLLLQIRVNFLPTHQGQAALADCQQRMSKLDFNFHGLFNRHKVEACDTHNEQLLFADAVFTPNAERCAALDANQYLKLAFLLHAVYESYALAHQLLQSVDIHQAADYLSSLPMDTQDAIRRTQAAAIDEQLETHSAPAAEPAAADWSQVSIIKTGSYTHAPSRVCVGVPIYNEAAYLAETLTSLKRQNLDDVHFLIIDNVSTDDSVEICLDTIGNDKRFTLLQQHENLGANENFKAAINLSQSEYFMWLGGHDFISDGYLAAAVNMLEHSPQTAMTLGQPNAVLNGQHHGLLSDALYDFSNDNPLIRYLNSVKQLTNCTIIHSLFRRKALDGYMMRQTISADHVLISHLLWQGKLHYLEGTHYYRRFFEQRASTQPERISGSKAYLSRHDFYRFYLDDLSQLYQGDGRMLRYLEGKILNILEERFGTQGLMEHDGLHLY